VVDERAIAERYRLLLRETGHDVVERTVLRLLKATGYSLQANKKSREGASHPDRDRQFAHINETVTAAIAAGQPAISVDTKKRELIGDFIISRTLAASLSPRAARSRFAPTTSRTSARARDSLRDLRPDS